MTDLKNNGVLVRHFNAPRIDNYLRITVGTPEQMQSLVDALKALLNIDQSVEEDADKN